MRTGARSGAAGALAGLVLVVAAAGMAALLGVVPGALSVPGVVAVAVLGLGTLAVIAFRRAKTNITASPRRAVSLFTGDLIKGPAEKGYGRAPPRLTALHPLGRGNPE